MSEVDDAAGVVTDAPHAAWRALGITLVAFALASLGDTWVYRNIQNPRVYEQDWGRMLRVMGFLGTWLVVALAVWMNETADGGRRTAATRRFWMLVGTPTLGGLVAEVLKLLLRRERPAVLDGLYSWRSFGERTWSTSGLALPSSHTLVAFAGAAMLARLYPRARWVGYTLAAGCGVTRILARAHFVSDVVLAAGLGWLVAWAVAQRWSPGVERV